MKLRSVLVMGALFLALGAYAWLFERNPVSPGDQPQGELAVLRLRSSEVSGLTLELGSSPIVLEKKDNHWRLRQPTTMDADADTVESLLSELEFLTAQRVIKNQNLDLAQYGLDRSRKVVRVKTISGENVLTLGSKTPIGSGMYLQLQGKPEVYVVADGLEKSMAKNPEDLRNRVVMECNLGDIVSLSLANPAGIFEVEQPKTQKDSSVSNWEWKTPTKDKQVNQEALSNVLWELRRLKFKRFLGEQKEPSPPWTKPMVTAAVWLKGDAKPRVLLVRDALPDGSYLCRLEGKPESFTLESYQVEPLKKDLSTSEPSSSKPIPASKTPIKSS